MAKIKSVGGIEQGYIQFSPPTSYEYNSDFLEFASVFPLKIISAAAGDSLFTSLSVDSSGYLVDSSDERYQYNSGGWKEILVSDWYGDELLVVGYYNEESSYYATAIHNVTKDFYTSLNGYGHGLVKLITTYGEIEVPWMAYITKHKDDPDDFVYMLHGSVSSDVLTQVLTDGILDAIPEKIYALYDVTAPTPDADVVEDIVIIPRGADSVFSSMAEDGVDFEVSTSSAFIPYHTAAVKTRALSGSFTYQLPSYSNKCKIPLGVNGLGIDGYRYDTALIDLGSSNYATLSTGGSTITTEATDTLSGTYTAEYWGGSISLSVDVVSPSYSTTTLHTVLYQADGTTPAEEDEVAIGVWDAWRNLIYTGKGAIEADGELYVADVDSSFFNTELTVSVIAYKGDKESDLAFFGRVDTDPLDP